MTKTSMVAIGIALVVCVVALSLFRHAASDTVARPSQSDVTTATNRQVAGKADLSDAPPSALAEANITLVDGTWDEESMRMLVCVRDSMFNSYSNCEASVLAEWTNRIQAVVGSAPNRQYNDTVGLFVAAVYRDLDRYANGERRVEFTDAKSLGAFLDTLLVLPHLVHAATRGRTYLADIHVACEGLVYKVLTNCKDIYAQKSTPDLTDAVDNALSRWIAFIESDSGYTRQFVEQDVALARVEDARTLGDMTWEEFVSDRVDQRASFLVNCGYVPQWMSAIKKSTVSLPNE